MIETRKPSARSAAGFFVALLTLSSCTVVVEENRPPRPEPGPICTREYAPVCAERFGDRQTFSNGCLAESAGYRIIREGQCRGRPPKPDEGAFCPKIYAPVCGRRGPDLRTFGNECLADSAGYRVIAPGPC